MFLIIYIYKYYFIFFFSLISKGQALVFSYILSMRMHSLLKKKERKKINFTQ